MYRVASDGRCVTMAAAPPTDNGLYGRLNFIKHSVYRRCLPTSDVTICSTRMMIMSQETLDNILKQMIIMISQQEGGQVRTIIST